MLIEDLRSLLCDVRRCAGNAFAGVGVLVTADCATLPVVSLRPQARAPTLLSAREVLISISNLTSELHDGFHVLTPDLQIAQLSQYFSPPIVHGLTTDPERRLGGRYMAALFGSTLPGILATGVASVEYGVVVFKNGLEEIALQ